MIALNSRKLNILFSSLVLIVYVATYIIAFSMGKPIAAYDFFTAIGVLPLVTLCAYRLPSYLYFPVILFVVGSNYFAMMLNFYEIFPMFDLILHFISGTILFALGFFLFCKKSPALKGIFLPLIFSLCFSLSGAVIWEIYEFTVDSLFGLATQGGSLTDTMGDLIAGTFGAVLGALGLFVMSKFKKEKFLRKNS